MEKEEQRLKSRQSVFLTTLQKRIQRDRNEQLLHRKSDSQILIQRNKNVLIDILKRHSIESKRTADFLKYALSSRSKYPGAAPLTLYLRSTSEQRLPKLKEASQFSAAESLYSVDLTAKKPQRRVESQMHSELTAPTKLPKLMNNKSLCEDEQPTIDQTQDSQAQAHTKHKRSSVESSEQSSLFVGNNTSEQRQSGSPKFTKHQIQHIKMVGASAHKP